MQKPEAVETPDEDIAARSVQPVPCPNCGSSRVENYCARCGQRAGDDLHVSVRAFAREALDGIFSFDSRIWNTLFTLLRRPGHLTVEHWRGRRARYVAPLQLYLFVSFCVFFITNVFFGRRDNFQASLTRVGAESAERIAAFVVEGTSWSYFFIVPALAAVLRLLYLRHERFFVPHLVFGVHIFAAGFVIQITAVAVDALFAPLLDLEISLLSLFLWSGVHVLLFLSLRRAYGEPPVKTLAKQAFLVALFYVVIEAVTRSLVLIGLRYYGNSSLTVVFSDIITVDTAVPVLLPLAGVALGALLYGLARRRQAGAP